MKWYSIPSVLISGLNSVLAAIILSLAVFHLYTDKSTNAPILPNERWICLVTCLVPFSAVWLGISILGIFASMTRRKMLLASMIIASYAILFGGSIYFTVSFGGQLDLEDVSAATLFNITKTQIDEQEAKTWIPGWLENIQKQSDECCGVITYRDYEEFWPDYPTKIPRSCCRNSKELPGTCPGDLTHIPFPNTPANFLKVDTGCMDAINEAARHHIRESYQNSIIMNIFIGLSVFCFLVLYVKRYLAGASEFELAEKRKRMQQALEGELNPELDGSNNKTDGSGPIFIASSNGIITASLDSMEGNAQMILVDGKSPEQKPSQNYYFSKEREPPKDKEREAPYITLSRPQPSMTKLNKANTVFAGLQQQQQRPTEAATGDDMTIGGGNIGRHEIYLAQDASEKPELGAARRNMAQAQEKQQQQLLQQPRILQNSTSGEDVGDVVYSDQEATGSPPGSPGGRRKKVRKLGLAHHHKNEHHHHHNKE